MTSWTTFQAGEPQLATRSRAILSSTVNAVLGTIRADGSPRLSGIDPFFLHGELWIGSMPGARKGADLRRDQRCSLHSIPWESRKVTDDAAHDAGDVKLEARAVLLADIAEQAEIMAWFKDERGVEPDDASDLFRIDLESVVLVAVADDLLVVDRWTEADGRRTVRRA